MTPPDEKRRREIAAEEAAKENAEILLLTPFAARPTIDFDRVKLGRSGVRKLIIRNPGDKPLDVLLDRLPKEEKGFSIDYVCFTLGGKEETSLLIGWTPIKAGGVRENIIVKFGGKFSAQIILLGSCIEPESKKRTTVTVVKPLGPRNSNVKSGSKTRPSVASSKLNAPPKISIPANPVSRKQGSPPKRLFGEAGSGQERRPGGNKFVCGTSFNPRDFAETDKFQSQSPRRETYVQERPAPSTRDIVESTPRVNRDIVEKVESTFDTRISNIMPPPAQDMRRTTFVPSKESLATVSDAGAGPGEEEVDFRRQTFVKLPPAPPAPAIINSRDTFVKLPPPMSKEKPINNKESFVQLPQPEPGDVQPSSESKSCVSPSQEPMNLSLAPLNLSSAKPKALSALLDQLNDVEGEPLDLSFPSDKKELQVSPVKNVNLTETLQTPRRYCPRVSDISLPDPESPSACAVKPQMMKTPLRVGADTKTPLRDPRLAQLMGSMNISGCGDLDLSLGSQFGDCSLAVNMDSPGRDRDCDFEEEDLEDFEENKENIDEEELDLIARARGTSALGSRSASSSWTERSPRLSSGTVVKSDPLMDVNMLPAVSEDDVHQDPEQEDREVLVEMQATQVLYEEKVVTEEIVEEREEVIELEFEIVDGEKKLVGERRMENVDQEKDTATVSITPLMTRRQAQCDISRMIEQHLGNIVPDQVRF